MFEYGVDDRQQLTHTGHQGYLLRFASRQQTLVEFPHPPGCGVRRPEHPSTVPLEPQLYHPKYYDGHGECQSHGLTERHLPGRPLACA